jgi:Fic/DOC family
VPPPPESVPRLVDEWPEWWHERHCALRGQPKENAVAGLTEFHHRFLRIHPFMDTNGRVARSITDQAARELLNESIGREFIEDVHAYYAALAAADEGDLKPSPGSNQSGPAPLRAAPGPLLQDGAMPEVHCEINSDGHSRTSAPIESTPFGEPIVSFCYPIGTHFNYLV